MGGGGGIPLLPPEAVVTVLLRRSLAKKPKGKQFTSVLTRWTNQDRRPRCRGWTGAQSRPFWIVSPHLRYHPPGQEWFGVVCE